MKWIKLTERQPPKDVEVFVKGDIKRNVGFICDNSKWNTEPTFDMIIGDYKYNADEWDGIEWLDENTE